MKNANRRIILFLAIVGVLFVGGLLIARHYTGRWGDIAVRSPTSRAIHAMREVAAALTIPGRDGMNPEGFHWLHSERPSSLLDGWGVPLYIDMPSTDTIRIRSLGPDKTLWTKDDIVRLVKGDRMYPPEDYSAQ